MLERDVALNNLILKIVHGSYLYGSSTPESDKDYVGIFIPPKDYVLGIKTCDRVELSTNPSSSGKANTKDDVDTVFYSLPKFVELAINNNPNIIEILYAPLDMTLVETDIAKELRQNRHLFLSKKVKHTLCGYAYSQRQKLLNKQYEGSRLHLVAKYGFDVKFAYHLIRLLSEGLETMKTGTLTLPCPNRQLLLDIKQGKVPLSDVLKIADEIELQVEEAFNKSPLQRSPDLEAINKLQIRLLENYWACKSSRPLPA